MNKCQSKLIIAHCVTERVLLTKPTVLRYTFFIVTLLLILSCAPVSHLDKGVASFKFCDFLLNFINQIFYSCVTQILQNYPQITLLTCLLKVPPSTSTCNDYFPYGYIRKASSMLTLIPPVKEIS